MVRENIAAYVKNNGIKQKFIADNIGISPSAVSQLLNGEREISAEEYINICNLFNVSCDYFVTNKQTNRA
ncbi:MAG: helix-turn-helix transcriptional regulator [Clostridia bacterium]|nr:helix-turn-helix transcriptional regulator [Clostridia bacterium]